MKRTRYPWRKSQTNPAPSHSVEPQEECTCPDCWYHRVGDVKRIADLCDEIRRMMPVQPYPVPYPVYPAPIWPYPINPQPIVTPWYQPSWTVPSITITNTGSSATGVYIPATTCTVLN